MNTKISEITGKSACVAWCPVRGFADVVAVGAKVSFRKSWNFISTILLRDLD
jgi:hypothetical protein